MTRRHILIAAAISLGAVLIVALLGSVLDSLEEHLTTIRYAVRGEMQPDSSIVLIYVDNDAIRGLGWPLRRNFHALLIKTLQELEVTAIGVDILFEDPHADYPEYDSLLCDVVYSAGNVVLAGYFRDVSSTHDAGQTHARVLGAERHLPFRQLKQSAAGIGHVNLMNDSDIPPFISDGENVMPALGVEILRTYLGVQREDVHFDGCTVAIGKNEKPLVFNTSGRDAMVLNFPGPPTTFAAYPFLEVLRSYDAVRAGFAPAIPLSSFKGKIALIGVIAEGRSEFRNTSSGSRYPTVALHAVFLDNALQQRFMRTTSDLLVLTLAFLIGMACIITVSSVHSPWNGIVAFALPVLSGGVSIILFITSSLILPILPILVVGVITTVSALVYRHQLMHQQVDVLKAEKEMIAAQLRDREAKLALLERELVEMETRGSAERTNTLMEEIRRYRAEIRSLSSRADDMEVYQPDQVSEENIEAEFEGIIYHRNGKMKPVVEFVLKIADSGAPVLILGETGTGKELVARAIHRLSRRGGPFVAVNCGALSESLLESELFGHEKGAFTGAIKEKPGRFELANGGTIFLDEIGEVSEAFQLKLLRVLQEGELERVGGTTTIKVDIRVVAATNRDLREQVELKKFRQDLYYRLNVLNVALPPLREREEDLMLLVNALLGKEDGEMRLSKNVVDAIHSYSWPGNIRELESMIKRSVLLAKGDRRTIIVMKDVPEELAVASQGAGALDDQVLDAIREKGFSRSSITLTAEELGGLNRGTVAEYLRGQCLKAFAEHGFSIEETVRYLTLSSDRDVNERARKKLTEYLVNLAEVVDKTQPWESVRTGLRPKTKNLPQRYHVFLEQAAEAYFRGLWKLENNA